LTRDDDIRGVLYGLNLLEIPSGNKDRMDDGQCCMRISDQVKHV